MKLTIINVLKDLFSDSHDLGRIIFGITDLNLDF